MRMPAPAKVAILALLAGSTAARAAAPKASSPQPPGTTFKDCKACPRMVVLPAGTFTIGSPASEPERHRNEGPQRKVTLRAFAVSQTEVTRAQFAAFAEATQRAATGGCDTPGDLQDLVSDHDAGASWREPRIPQDDRHPVVCVSWQDAVDYTAWLTRTTGHTYGLPSESQWEYAARGGTTTAYFWGDSADTGCSFMNGGDGNVARAIPGWTALIERDRQDGAVGARLVACDDRAAFTAPVGSYKPNRFGLRDITGNVWEWAADCYETSYDTLPLDGASRTKDACAARLIRGGCWGDYPRDLRSASRHSGPPGTRRNDLGFRVTRSLEP